MCRNSFRTTSITYVPPSERLNVTWVSTSSCVWDGPVWLRSKQRLKNEAYNGLEPLFKSSLQLPNASLDDVLEDLSQLKDREKGYAKVEDVEKIYDYLWHNTSTAGDQRQEVKKLMQVFLSTTFL